MSLSPDTLTKIITRRGEEQKDIGVEEPNLCSVLLKLHTAKNKAKNFNKQSLLEPLLFASLVPLPIYKEHKKLYAVSNFPNASCTNKLVTHLTSKERIYYNLLEQLEHLNVH